MYEGNSVRASGDIPSAVNNRLTWWVDVNVWLHAIIFLRHWVTFNTYFIFPPLDAVSQCLQLLQETNYALGTFESMILTGHCRGVMKAWRTQNNCRMCKNCREICITLYIVTIYVMIHTDLANFGRSSRGQLVLWTPIQLNMLKFGWHPLDTNPEWLLYQTIKFHKWIAISRQNLVYFREFQGSDELPENWKTRCSSRLGSPQLS